MKLNTKMSICLVLNRTLYIHKVEYEIYMYLDVNTIAVLSNFLLSLTTQHFRSTFLLI